ncbi:translocation/assembly module TamB domain-containing protein [Pseudomonas turukhanskensis]|uniref:Translocation/assembly module TamB n=1 Tax=Pseudomonas turukhanskensis TaxID=1806536 RepID=A0A9W6NGW6_9PSED|nr:translocation/assembly module TamB domain-containing protein [Pseudomonas turukhanskensis]GLK90267.1 translocation/assembly module TamB [Pseudomonas turukhanskensis]
MSWLKRGALAGLALLVSLVVAVALLLGTERGSRLLLAQVPGLQVQAFAGRLGSSWSADSLVWEQQGDHVALTQVQFAWSPACLLKLTLCLDQVHAQALTLQLADSTSSNDEPLTLPDLKLPLALQLGDIQLGRIVYNGGEEASQLQLVAHWGVEGLAIERLQGSSNGVVLDVHGTLDPNGQWPLQVQGSVQLPAPDSQPWSLAVDVQGELLESLAVQGQSSGYLNAHVQGSVQPLAEGVPAQATVRAEHFVAAADVPALNAIELSAAGTLDAGYQVNGRAGLAAEGGDIPLTLAGRVTASGADIQALTVQAEAEQHITLSGQLAWADSFTADAQFTWLDFPWRRLLPGVEEPAVSLQRLVGQVHYQAGSYLGHFAADLNGPAGAFSLSSPVSGDLAQVHLVSLLLQAGQGKAEGQATIGFADGIRWDSRLQLSQLNPAYWLAELPGTLGGSLRSQGQYREQLKLDADLDLNGRLRGQPAVLQVHAAGAGQRWQVDKLDVRLGDNRVQGQGSLDQRLAGQLSIAMPRLGQLWPQLSGQLSGRLDLAGSLQAPQGQLNLQGTQLAYQQQTLASLVLAAKLDGQQRGTLELTGSGIHSGDTDLGRLHLQGNGNRQQQRLSLDLDGSKLKLALAADGTLAPNFDWRGRISSGEVHSAGQQWRLQQAAPLQRLADGQLNLGAHCWQSGVASLCGDDQRLLPEPRLRWRLRDFPMQTLAQWWPADFAWQGNLNADIKLDLPASGPNGDIRLDLGSGTLRVREQGQWLDLPYDRFSLASQLRPQRIDSQLDFHGPQLGQLTLNTQLDPRPANKPLSGSFELAGLDLSLARPFVPMVERIGGHLNGSGTVSGGLLAPHINGRLIVQDGEVSGSELPVSVQGLQAEALITGERLQLTSNWHSGEAGEGSLKGTLGWAYGLDADVQLRGSRLPVVVEPYATLEVHPDLNLRLAEQQLSVKGQVQVPRGKIEIRQLPPSTVQVSEDAQVAGSHDPDARQGQAVAMDIDIRVGAPEGQPPLTFNGFGLSAELAGRLHMGDNLDTRGELNLNKGRYRAYGQRLTLRRARLLFAGPVAQPYLDVEAVRQVDSVTAGLRISGNAEQPTTTVFSEPAMSQQQALSYLVLGRPASSGAGDNNMLAEAALGLGLMGSSGVTGAMAQRLGISDFQLDTGGTGDKTSVVASGNLSEKLSLRYGVGVFEPASTIALRYALTKKVYVEAASGLASSLDIFYKRDF